MNYLKKQKESRKITKIKERKRNRDSFGIQRVNLQITAYESEHIKMTFKTKKGRLNKCMF